MKKDRMIITTSFDDKDDYDYVKSQPNSSEYIRTLVRNDRNNNPKDKTYIDEKFDEIKKYIDSKFKSTPQKINSDAKNDLKKMMNGFKL